MSCVSPRTCSDCPDVALLSRLIGRKLLADNAALLAADRAAFAEDLAADLPALQKALAKVAKEDREKETTQRAKNEAMARNDMSFTTGAGWLAASCQLAGLADLAAKVRSSGRRPGQTAAEENSGAGAPQGGGAPPPAAGG